MIYCESIPITKSATNRRTARENKLLNISANFVVVYHTSSVNNKFVLNIRSSLDITFSLKNFNLKSTDTIDELTWDIYTLSMRCHRFDSQQNFIIMCLYTHFDRRRIFQTFFC